MAYKCHPIANYYSIEAGFLYFLNIPTSPPRPRVTTRSSWLISKIIRFHELIQGVMVTRNHQDYLLVITIQCFVLSINQPLELAGPIERRVPIDAIPIAIPIATSTPTADQVNPRTKKNLVPKMRHRRSLASPAGGCGKPLVSRYKVRIPVDPRDEMRKPPINHPSS